jgi:hypothetical protein
MSLRLKAEVLVATMVAVLLVVLMVASSAPAEAEDAWVLLAEQKRSTRGGPYQRTSLDPVRGYTTLQECAATLDSLQSAGDQRWGPSTLYRFMGDPKVEVFFVTFQCLPAAVDPRAPARH